MTRRMLFIGCLNLFMIACSCNTKSANSKIQRTDNDSTLIYINEIEGLISEYANDKRFKEHQIVSDSPDYVKVIILEQNRELKCLKVQSAIQEKPEEVFSEILYFGNDSGFPIVYTYPITDEETSVQIVKKGRDVISYTKSNKKGIFINSLDSFTTETKLSAIAAILNTSVWCFKDISYPTIRTSIKSIPVLVVVADSIDFYDKPDINGVSVGSLPKGELLFFLGSVSKVEGVGKMAKSWFKISSEDKKKDGWIIASFDNVKYYTDGD